MQEYKCVNIAPQIGNATETREPPQDREWREGSWLATIANVFLIVSLVFQFGFLSPNRAGGWGVDVDPERKPSSFIWVFFWEGGVKTWCFASARLCGHKAPPPDSVLISLDFIFPQLTSPRYLVQDHAIIKTTTVDSV